jgi:hypothetical protein
MNKSKLEIIKEAFASWWVTSPKLAPFLFGWFLSAWIAMVAPINSPGDIFLVIFIVFCTLIFTDKFAKKTYARMCEEFKESGEYDELKEILMKEAREMAKKLQQRKFMAVCRGCDDRIYDTDSYYVSGKNQIFCYPCCRKIEAAEKKAKQEAEAKQAEKTNMCWTCGVKFATWTIVHNGEAVGESSGKCRNCLDVSFGKDRSKNRTD